MHSTFFVPQDEYRSTRRAAPRAPQEPVEADPQHRSFLTINLTFKPANYYVYGPIADVANPDCYPISLGADATMVREVVETARYGAGPRPVTFTFQGCYEVPHDPKARAAKRFPRPPFAGEERLMLHYALGAGARGLFNYIHCSEKSKRFMSHGSREYPDVWHAIGRTYREVEHVAPLLAQAHPTKLATADRDKVYVSTLLAGPDALLLVCVNERYEQQAHAFPYDPQTDVKLSVPALPWLKPKAAWVVREDDFEPLPLIKEGGRTQVTLGRLDVAGIVLVAAKPALVKPLAARYNARQQKIGNALLAAWRQKQAAAAAQEVARRRITGEFADCVVKGTGIGAYGIKNRAFWNPHKEAYWAFEFGRNDAAEDRGRGAEWRIPVSAKQAGQEHTIYTVCGTWGRPARFTLVAPDGKELLRREISGRFEGALVTLKATFPVAGEYVLRFIQDGPGPKGGRITSSIYVIPADRNPPEALP